MRSSLALSASRTSIHFSGTDREAGQCRQYQLAPEVSRRSDGAKLPSGWQGQQYFETGHRVRESLVPGWQLWGPDREFRVATSPTAPAANR